MPTNSDDNRPNFQLSQREVLILVIAVAAGLGSGVLLSLAGVVIAQAVLGGISAAAAMLLFLDKIME